MSKYFRRWQRQGTGQEIHAPLRRETRLRVGRNPQAIAGEDRSPERQNDEKKGEEYGFDGGQLIKGHKRFIFVDPWGRLISVLVIKANCSEQKGGMVVVDETDEAALKSMQ